MPTSQLTISTHHSKFGMIYSNSHSKFGMMCSNSQLTGAHPFLSLFSFVINIEITEHNVEIQVKIITRFSEGRQKNEHHS